MDTILARLASSDRACQLLAAPIALPDSDTTPALAAGSGLRRLSATRIGAIVTAGTRAGLVGCRVRAGLLREGNAGRQPANTLIAWPQSRPRRSSPPAQRRRWSAPPSPTASPTPPPACRVF